MPGEPESWPDCNEARDLEAAGRYGEAIAPGELALARLETAYGAVHPAVAPCLGVLGVAFLKLRDPTRAKPLLLRSLVIKESTLGKKHRSVSTDLNNLAAAYMMQGAFDQAEPLYVRALAIREGALGEHHPATAETLNNLANLYMEQGSYDRAEPLYQRALEIREAAVRADGSEWTQAEVKSASVLAQSLNNLATFYYKARGWYAQAEPLYQRAFELRMKALGWNHPDVAESCNNLANLYFAQELYEQARPLYERSLAIYENAFGKSHPDVAKALGNLANVHVMQGAYERAEPLFERAYAINGAAQVTGYSDVRLLNSFAQLRLARHRLEDAVALFALAFATSEMRLRREAPGFSEARLASFLQLLRRDEERLYALARAHPEEPGVQRLALAAVLLRKGRSGQEIAATSRAIYRGAGKFDLENFNRLRDLRAQLAQLSLDGPGAMRPSDHRQRLKTVSEQVDALEADLAKRSAPLRAQRALPSPNDIPDRVASALPADGALVEFIAYEDRPLVAEPGTLPSQAPQPLRYLALVVFPDASIHVVDLGPAAPIDIAASLAREAFGHSDPAYLAHAQALYELVFGPITPLLQDVCRVFLSPDGQLGLIPFAALHDGRRFLVDAFDITYVTSGKDLLRFTEPGASTNEVVVFADPRIDNELQADAPVAVRSSKFERLFSELRANWHTQRWTPLPGTRREAEAVQRLLPQAELFLGAEATKDRLLHLSAPGVLHIATHAFFLEDVVTAKGDRAVGYFGALSDDGPLEHPSDPLLRAGILLAGARARAADGSDIGNRDPGNSLVTALELAGLDLWGTELVVLSACDTGRGDVRLGQGVYGLRRALIVAGAESVVMSLWKVNDESTSELMEEYYRKLLEGKGRSAALQEAMRAFRARKPHPYYWAPFIALGRDAPLWGMSPPVPEQL